MPTVIAGYQLPNDNTTALTRTNLNLMGIPTVTIGAGEIVDSMISTVGGTKIIAGTLPLSAFDSASQARASGGLKNYVPNPQFDLWPIASPITLQSAGNYASAYGYTYYNQGSITGTISQVAVTPGASDSVLGSAKWWYQFATTNTGSQQLNLLQFNIPNARLFSGQTITLGFAVQVFSGALSTISCSVGQLFGTGGSPSSSVYTNATFNAQPSGTPSKIYATITLPTVAGKTFGTNGDDSIQVSISCTPSSTFTVGITNIQDELSAISTAFENSLARNTGFDAATNCGIAEGRLTLTSGDPLMVSDVASASMVYWTPYMGNRMALWDGNFWRVIPFNETALPSWTVANSTVYDVFARYDGGKAALEYLAWTNATTRATAVAYYDGVLCKSGDKTRRLLGSFATTSTGVCSVVRTGSGAGGYNGVQILLDNVYNRQEAIAVNSDTTATWTYATATWRQANGSVSPNYNAITALNCLSSNFVHATYRSKGLSAGNKFAVGSNTTTPIGRVADIETTNFSSAEARVSNQPLGLYTYYAIEESLSGGTVTFYGNDTTSQVLEVRKQF